MATPPRPDTSGRPRQDDLAEQFRRGLRERLDALTAARPRLDADGDARSAVRSLAHALKGAGGTYGFPEISAAAATVEAAADTALAGGLDALLEVLRGTLERLDTHQAPLAARPALDRPAAPSTAERPSRDMARILVVDDDLDITRLLERALGSPDRAVEVAGSAAGLDRLLARRRYDLIVLDLLLPDADGRTLLAELKQEPRTAAIPVVVLSGLHSSSAKAECFALGADAYVEKPFDPIVVAAAATSRLERARHLRPDGRTDPETELPSCAAFREAFEAATAGAAPPAPVVIALFQLDQHTALATSAGYASTSRALTLAGRALTRAVEGAAPLAHWGGGTFAALLLGRTEAEATALAERAMAAVRRTVPEPPVERYTFSAGVAAWVPGQGLAETVVAVERLALAARNAGGDTVRSGALREGAGTILLAEDDDLIASVVQHRLEREGMKVERFRDGLAALQAAPGVNPALAILDVKMPAMDGFELLGRLRAEPSFGRAPILMLTSMGQEQDVVRGLELGADEYMIKPFSPVELVARVRRLLARR